MKYCADTWFMLEAFGKNPHALQLMQGTVTGKERVIIPIIVFVEATKKLLQRGISQNFIDEFFSTVEASEKVELFPLDKAIGQEAARISLSFHVPLIDSLVAATAKLTECDVLLGKDDDYQLLAKAKYLKIRNW